MYGEGTRGRPDRAPQIDIYLRRLSGKTRELQITFKPWGGKLSGVIVSARRDRRRLTLPFASPRRRLAFGSMRLLLLSCRPRRSSGREPKRSPGLIGSQHT